MVNDGAEIIVRPIIIVGEIIIVGPIIIVGRLVEWDTQSTPIIDTLQ